MFQSVKHMAFASPNAKNAVDLLQDLFGEAQDGHVKDVPAGAYRVAKFTLGGIEMQFCEPLVGDIRFSRHLAEQGPGLHHICFTVNDIRDVVARAQTKGVSLQACPSCGVTGSHVHPEGWIAFFAAETLPELQIEVMQVYKPGEKEKYWGDRAEV
jgi:methylmalonyl-CoA/ethylmalonyl-CoA epimerase